MAAIACDICGGSLSMDASGDFANCDLCGMKHTKDRLKTKALEITGTVEVSNMAGLESLMKRGYLALEDAKWGEARKYFDLVLDINPEYSPAYVGKLCVAASNPHWLGKNDYFTYVFKQESDLARHYKPLDDMPDYQKAVRFADENYRAQLEGYNDEIKKRLAELEKKYSFYMIVTSRSNHSPSSYSSDPHRISMSGHCCVGSLRTGMVFNVFRTGKQFNNTTSDRSGSEIWINKGASYGDIEYGDVAYISIEEERKRAEQEHIERELRAIQEKKDREDRERREAAERERQRIEKEKREQSMRWKQQGLCEHCGGSLTGFFSKKCKACGKEV